MWKLFVLCSILLISNPAISQTGELSKQRKALSAKELAAIKAANIKKAANTQFQYFIIKSINSGYGYSIYMDGNLYIQQNTVPGMPGNKGFTNTSIAVKCARLVIQKMKAGKNPPAVTQEELKRLGVQ